MRRQNSQEAYLPLPETSVNAEFKAVSAATDKLGLFWLTSPSEPAITRVEVDPKEAFLRVGDTQQFTAKVIDPTGAEMQVEVEWAAVAARVASVDANGLLTAKGPGIATLTATAAGQTTKVTVRVQGDAVGPSTFVHDNPFPTGNDLFGGVFAAGNAAFVGGNGTVLVRNGGGDWSRLFSGPALTLKAIAGTTTSDAVAVGVSATTGVLVEMKNGAPNVATFQTIEPRALWFDGTHGMAVGTGNDVLVRRNGTWVTEYSPSIEALLSVIGDGQGGFTTVGSRGSLYQFDPQSQTWNSLFQTQLSVLLTAGLLVAPDEAWAVGGGKLWHFKQDLWQAINLPATPALSDLTAVGFIDGHVTVAGRAGKEGHLLVFDPNAPAGDADAGTPDGGTTSGQWTTVPLRGPQLIRGFFAQGAQGYAVGDFGAVWSYAGGTFTEVSRGFYGNVADVSVAGTAVVAAVNECEKSDCQTRKGAVMIRTGQSTWTELGGATQPFTEPVLSVAAKSNTEVLASTATSLYRYDGLTWSAFPQAQTLFDLQYCGETAWGVGSFGLVLTGQGATFTPQAGTGAGDLYAVHCPDPLNLWTGGDAALLEKSGSKPFAARQSQTVNHGLWRAVWSPAPGEAFAVGDARYGVYWNTVDLIELDTPGGILPEVLTGLWGSSADNLYAVGYTVTPQTFGYAVRFDGAQWRLVDSGAHRRATALHGSSSTELWIGTEGGGLLRAVPP